MVEWVRDEAMRREWIEREVGIEVAVEAHEDYCVCHRGWRHSDERCVRMVMEGHTRL